MSDYEDLLFVGGPYDGEWRQVQKGAYEWCLPVQTRKRFAPAMPLSTPTVETFKYRRMAIHTNKYAWSFMIPAKWGVADDSAIATLLAGYRPCVKRAK